MQNQREAANKLFLHYCFKKSCKAKKVYKAIISQDYKRIRKDLIKARSMENEQFYELFQTIRKNSKKKEIKKVLYNISLDELLNQLEKNNEKQLRMLGVEKHGEKYSVPAESLILGALNDALGQGEGLIPDNDIKKVLSGEKRRMGTSAFLGGAGLATLATLTTISLIPGAPHLMLNPANYMSGIPALFLWFTYSSQLFATALGLGYLVPKFYREYKALAKHRKEIIETLSEKTSSMDRKKDEKLTLREILLEAKKNNEEALESLKKDRLSVTKRSEVISEYFLCESAFKAVLSASMAKDTSMGAPILGPVMIGTSLGVCGTRIAYLASNSVFFRKKRKEFKRLLEKSEPEEAFWNLISFLQSFKKREIIGNYLVIGDACLNSLLSTSTAFINPATLSDAALWVTLGMSAYAMGMSVYMNRQINKEKRKVDRLNSAKNKVRIAF